MPDDELKRPSPEEMLELAKSEEKAKKGQLTIYLGYAPGVGKTYAMLSDAHLRKKEGLDIVVGFAETHNRPETEYLLEGLEVISPLIVEYKSLKLKEIDFEKIIKRRPQIVIIDELAHTNPPSFSNSKRYQDIENLLNHGIDVYTAVNVQHIESFKDIILQISKIQIKEAIPDKFFQEASEIKLVDITPEELLKRLKEGKIYLEDIVKSAADKYFRVGNLLALRQITLRVVADSVDEKMRLYMMQHAIAGPWSIRKKVLVGVFASPYANQLIRAAYRFASEIDAQWIALHVETQKNKTFMEDETKWLNGALDLVRNLGGQIVWLKGDDPAKEMIDYAKDHNVTKIVIGKPKKFNLLSRSIPEKLITKTKNIDIYMLDLKEEAANFKREKFKPIHLNQYALGLINIFLVSILAFILKNYLNQTNTISLFLLALIINAFFLQIVPTLTSTFVSMLIFDFFFVPPFYSFAISDLNYFFSFIVYSIAVATISVLASKLKNKVQTLKESQKREIGLYELSSDLVMAKSINHVLSLTINHIKKLFICEAAIFIKEQEKFKVGVKTEKFEISPEIKGIVSWSFVNKKSAGFSTETFSNAKSLYLPMLTAKEVYGVIAVNITETSNILKIDDRIALDAITHLAAMTLERINKN
jgi:two-component system sensor histidine kinase KdpD